MSFVIAPRHTKKVTLSFCAWWYIRFFHNRRRWPLHCVVVNVVNSSCDLIPGCAMVGGSFVVQHGAVTIATVTDKNANRTRASTWMVAVITVWKLLHSQYLPVSGGNNSGTISTESYSTLSTLKLGNHSRMWGWPRKIFAYFTGSPVWNSTVLSSRNFSMVQMWLYCKRHSIVG